MKGNSTGQENMQRRASDERIQTLITDVEAIKAEVKRNTEITEEVRDVLASFRVIAKVAKWLTIVVACVTAMYHGFDVVAHK